MSDQEESSRYGQLWTREESILAFELYCRIPFQRTKSNNPAVQSLAELLGRTPASVARKLGNFGAFDPHLKNKKISGLTHTSKLDQQVWEEFHRDWNELVLTACRLKQQAWKRIGIKSRIKPPEGASEVFRLTKQRIHQKFFRDSILSSYSTRCCVTGLQLPECLIASHIIPWSVDERYRTDPTNGLCLSATFDRLFDSGLMTVTDDLAISFSSLIMQRKSTAEKDLLLCYEGQQIRQPERFLPCKNHLKWHQLNRFKK